MNTKKYIDGKMRKTVNQLFLYIIVGGMDDVITKKGVSRLST